MRFWCNLLVAVLVLLVAVVAEAAPRIADDPAGPADAFAVSRFTPEEMWRLQRGLQVNRPHYLTPGTTRILGTFSSVLVKAPPEQVIAMVLDPHTLGRVLPHTLRVRAIESKPGFRRFELTQGKRWVHATFTLVVRRVSQDRVRFWLDRSRPHGIADAWGWFDARPFDHTRTLMSVATAVDIGSGPLRWLFGGVVQREILATPQSMKRALEQTGSRRASTEQMGHRATLRPS